MERSELPPLGSEEWYKELETQRLEKLSQDSSRMIAEIKRKFDNINFNTINLDSYTSYARLLVLERLYNDLDMFTKSYYNPHLNRENLK